MIPSVQVGGVNYTVIEESKLSATASDGSTIWLNGHYLSSEAQIKIDADVAPSVKAAVLWHEISHAILTHAGIRDESETTVTALGYGLAQVVRDNPDLIAFTRKALISDSDQ